MVFIETSIFTRLIYGYLTDEIWLLTIYAKNEASTIPPHVLKKIAQEVSDG